MSKLIISISGVRGIIGQNLTPTVAAQFASAFGTYLLREQKTEKKTVCIGRDSRPSGQMIFSAVAAGLTACGLDVIDLGIVTTPGAGIMLTENNCAGGIVITASHNPTPYNGIKLLLDNGIAPPPATAEKIKQIYNQKEFILTESTKCGKILKNDNTDSVHIEKVLALVDSKKIAQKKYHVILDSVNGAGGRAGVKLLEKLGCKVTKMNYQPTGLFAHTPEPIKENLTELAEQVKIKNADLGFAQDPDADRLAVVDHQGNYIGEEYTLALCAKKVLAENKTDTCANLSTSRMIDDVAASAKVKVIRTPVGEANVAKAMIENNCLIGGEGNGGVIDLRVGPIRDSLVAMAHILGLMAETDLKISELKDSIGSYYMNKTKIPADPENAQKLIQKAIQTFKDAKCDTSDGCRLDFQDGWIHIRTSNTEPVMRIIAETKDKETAEKYLTRIDSIRQEI